MEDRQDAARNIPAFEGHKNIVAPSICDICDCHVFINIRCELLMLTGMGLMQHLLDKGIPCAIYYPIPLHSQKHTLTSLQRRRFSGNQSISDGSTFMHTELDDEQIKFITDSVLEYLGYFSRDAMYRVFYKR
jgi:dTDP-4-amino-4,6-dideoxygalactose transaminase